MVTNPQTRLAIVDDEPIVCKALARLLSTYSFEAETYASAVEFLRSLDDRVPDCLITDLQMPGMSGLALHQHLTKTGVRIPTIVITAYDTIDLDEQCLSAGVSAYLRKPLKEDILIAAIQAAIARVTES